MIVAKLVYGWGRTRLDAPEISVPNEINGVPHSFHCQIKDFFCFKNELRGVVGVIEESGHIYNDLWVVFYTRTVGIYNFTDNLPFCDIQIGSNKPEVIGEWREINSGIPLVIGYCLAGESLKHIEDAAARTAITNRIF